MRDVAQADVLAAISAASKAFEVYEASTFKLYRKRSDGLVKEVTLQILDAGPSDPTRYHVEAVDEDGRGAGGNPDSDLNIALATLHWHELDR